MKTSNTVTGGKTPGSLISTWIPVGDALPQLFERVLVYDPSIPKFKSKDGVRSHNFVVIGYYRGEDGWSSPWFVPDGGEPTHWMSLPKEPTVQVLEDAQGRFIASR